MAKRPVRKAQGPVSTLLGVMGVGQGSARTAGTKPVEPRQIGQGEARQVVGHLGTAIFGGYVNEREKNAKLVGVRKYQTYSQIMANTATVAAGVRFFLNLVAKARWTLEAAEDTTRVEKPRPLQTATDLTTQDMLPDQEAQNPPTPVPAASDQSQEIADAIKKMMGDMETNWHRVVRRAAMYRFYGFSVQEWTAKKREDGLIGMLDVAPRPQSTIIRWDVDITGRVIGIVQQSEQTHEELYLPRNKVIYVVDDSLNDSPEGLGLFRHIVEAADRLKRYEELESFSFETDLRGIPIGRAPLEELREAVERGELTEAQAKVLEQGMEDFILKHIKNPQLGLLLDSTPYRTEDEAGNPSATYKWDMELLTGDGTTTGQESVLKAIDRINREIARVLGVEHLLLGDGDRGSFALSADKSRNFMLIIESTLKELEETFQKDFVRPLMLMNGWPEELTPTLKTEAIQFRDVEQITSAIRELSTAGIQLHPEDEAIGEIFDLLGLSRPDPALAEQEMLKDRAMALAMMESQKGLEEDDPEEEAEEAAE